MISPEAWQKVTAWESSWWGSCQNTFGEEEKQLVYARCMGLERETDWRGNPCFNVCNRSILDVGGGPVSMLLKCYNLAHGVVLDPGRYPPWVYRRYQDSHISLLELPAETHTFPEQTFDEVWLYNVLQHVMDPVLVLRNAWTAARTLRLFEWIYAEQNEGHPHVLTPELFEEVLPSPGAIEAKPPIRDAPGMVYYGVWSKS